MKPSVIVILISSFTSIAHAEDGPTYERDVKPLLAKRCTVCHNAAKLDQADISGGLALDSFDAALKGTAEHVVIVAGKADASEIFKRLIDTDEDQRMPLSDKPLVEAERNLLRGWIDAGAPRGEISSASAEEKAVTRSKRPLVHTLDVVIPVAIKASERPKGLGDGPVRLLLKVGPLPSVTALAFRGDGRILAVGTHGAVVLWDLMDGRPAKTLGDVPGPVHALAFSRDGRRLAVGSGLPARSGSVRVYEVPGGTLLRDFTGHGDVVFGLAFRPDDAQLASASFDQTVRLWDLIRGRPAGVFRGHSDFVYDVVYDRDGKSVLSVSKDRSIKRIDVAKVKELRTYSEHDDDVLAIALSGNGGQFVTAGNEPQLRWWSADGEKSTKRVGGHSGPVHQLAFNADGSKLISAGGDGSVRIWDGRAGSALKTLPGATDWQYAVSLSADGKTAAAGGWDGVVRVWDVDSGLLRANLIQPPGDDPAGCEWLAVSPGGLYSASTGMDRLLRWKAGDRDVQADDARAAFDRPEALAQTLRGQPVPALLK